VDEGQADEGQVDGAQERAGTPPEALHRRLLAREAERHATEVALLRQAERSALDRVEDLTRQVRALRARVHEVEAEHATERMRADLELARLKAEVAGLQAAARRRADALRQSAEQREALRQHTRPVGPGVAPAAPEPVEADAPPASAAVEVPPQPGAGALPWRRGRRRR